MQGQGLCAAASLRSAISGSKGQRRKNLSRKAMRANRHCFTLPATSKGAGFLLTLWDHPLSSHDASRTVCLGEEFSWLIFLIGQRLAPWGINFLFLGVHFCAVRRISQNPLLWTQIRLEHNLRGNQAAFVRWWMEAIRSWW